MTPRATQSPHPCRNRPSIGLVLAALLALAGLAAPASATLTAITTVPEAPAACDSVLLVVSGVTPTPCYRIVRADLEGPVELGTMGPIPTYEFRVAIVLRETVAPDSEACPAVIEPYRQVFTPPPLRFGRYQVKAVETVLPLDSDVPRDSSTLVGSFDVTPTDGCPPPPPPESCYLLDFTRHDPSTRVGTCSAIGPPGGTACAEVLLVNGTAVGGVQTVIDVLVPGTPGEPLPGEAVHAISVLPTGRAAGFQVAWSTEGSRTRILLYSSTGASIPPGGDAILRVCYAIGADVAPGVYALRYRDTIVADPDAHAIPPCPTFAEVVGRLCVMTPGCDLNGDGHGDILDVIQLVNCALAQGDSSEACPDTVTARADCNEDGAIDVRDVICCVRKILGGGGFGGGDPGGSTGDATRIGFAGPVRWITPLEGRAEITIAPGADFGGIDFGIDATSSGARIQGMRLAAGSGYQLESSVTAGGAMARAMLLTMGAGSGSATVVLDLVPALPVSGGGVLSLAGAHSATRLARTMPTSVVSSSVPVPEESAPEAPSVASARPNPFREETEITYALPAEGRVVLRIYGASGRLLRTLVDGIVPAGVHRARWDGRDSAGRPVGSGIYFFKFSADRVTRTSRILLLR